MRWYCDFDDLESNLPQFVFDGNVCILTCISTTTCILKMFIVRFGSKKPEDDTMQALSVLLGFGFRIQEPGRWLSVVNKTYTLIDVIYVQSGPLASSTPKQNQHLAQALFFTFCVSPSMPFPTTCGHRPEFLISIMFCPGHPLVWPAVPACPFGRKQIYLPLGLFPGTIISTIARTSFSSILCMCPYQRSHFSDFLLYAIHS